MRLEMRWLLWPAPWAWPRGLQTWAVFCRKSQFVITLQFFIVSFCVLWSLNSFWGLWCPSRKFELIPTRLHIYFDFLQFPRVEIIKKIIAGPDSKTDPPFPSPCIFSYLRAQMWLERNGHFGSRLRLGHVACKCGLFFQKRSICHNSSIFYHVISCFILPKFILGLRCPSKKFELILTCLWKILN